MRVPSKKGVLRFVLALPLLIVALLNVSGFCWSQKRFLSDQELIDAAIRLRLRYQRANNPHDTIYKSVEELKALNPGCCTLERQKNEDSELPQVISSMLGMYASTVEITYRIADSGPEPFYNANVIIGCCGDIGRFYGMPQSYGPKSISERQASVAVNLVQEPRFTTMRCSTHESRPVRCRYGTLPKTDQRARA